MVRELMFKLFNATKPDYEYWVYTKDIKVPRRFIKSRIGDAKFKRKNSYYDRTGEFESRIILNKNMTLVDGYSSYRIAKLRNIEKVPVYFQ